MQTAASCHEGKFQEGLAPAPFQSAVIEGCPAEDYTVVGGSSTSDVNEETDSRCVVVVGT